MGRRIMLVVGLALVLPTTTGCTTHFPADPEGTLTSVDGGTLRVGASINPPFVEEKGEELTGDEVELVEDYALTRDADIEWTEGGEEELMSRLGHGELDLVIGGLTAKTPWAGKAGLTRPYTETTDRFGTRRKHVLAVPLGENAFLLDLDTFLHHRDGSQ
ncbi:transporter substrate-binding domain-containing protein [Arthrobacter agilis]|uniref:transporter substrate-binding domain-containing protein n=1 Tax=Arthrobacter agilis TaxID=37921 RepID=UPI000B584956|nr:transporter substrate-binding domain-containing protein [Arthrobacter agilis]OUM42444.1 hypothetical protein B8W74_08395 [Arthrobacter agilis]TPV26551.1 transporter substrate-binding domain-containing protein [Arthrobacter agilis]